MTRSRETKILLLEQLIRKLPNTYWGRRYMNLQRAKELGIRAVDNNLSISGGEK